MPEIPFLLRSAVVLNKSLFVFIKSIAANSSLIAAKPSFSALVESIAVK